MQDIVFFDDKHKEEYIKDCVRRGDSMQAAWLRNKDEVIARQQRQEEKARYEAYRTRAIGAKTKYIPAKSGVYYLVFPEGHIYIGSSRNVRQRIKRHFYELFPPEKKRTQPAVQWYVDCHNVYPDLTIEQIEVHYKLADNYHEEESRLLQGVAAEERSRYFNSVWE